MSFPASPPPTGPGFSGPAGPRALQPTPTTDLSDGEWHRMHPATPLLKGGLVLLVVIGYLIANLRERLIDIFLPEQARGYSGEGDPLDWIVANNLVFLAIVAVLVVVLIVVGVMFLSWRFHTFRITATDVEVRKGVIFRSQRRAPLDRVQGVNLTRPFVARLVGLAKLEVVGAGADANVPLEYLSTRNAEKVRTDILRRASGLKQARAAAIDAANGVPPAQRATLTARTEHLLQDFADGATGLVLGAEDPVAEPASVVHIPFGRMLASHLVSPSTVILLIYVVGMIIGAFFEPFLLVGLIPAIFAFGAFYIKSLMKVLRYSIAPTPDGLRVTFGLTTTITEIIPPGRIHAAEVTQSIAWRPFGWYSLRINRMNGKSATAQGQNDPFTTLLPVGTRADVVRVLGLVFPTVHPADLEGMLDQGVNGPRPGDPFTTSPGRAWWVHPLMWRRNGALLTPNFLLLRRGLLWHRLALIPLARIQSTGIRQGWLARLTRLASLQAHVIPGVVRGDIEGLARDDAQRLFADVERAALDAARDDRSHRWAEGDPVPAPQWGPESIAIGVPAPAEGFAPVPADGGFAPAPPSVSHAPAPAPPAVPVAPPAVPVAPPAASGPPPPGRGPRRAPPARRPRPPPPPPLTPPALPQPEPPVTSAAAPAPDPVDDELLASLGFESDVPGNDPEERL
ncbi:PH domain-containing protein [Microbacterium gorillae]|uniref:PH domain-containing protein n=1 Tax=Microbacterium gorillae TaxID=1231063 RepID=UPI000B1CC1EF|nr:PH domain-containing protein [Microbacterium gorillae]